MVDAKDFDAIFRLHYDRVMRYALRRVVADRAADVVSEVFMTAWRRRDDQPVDQLPWLLAVARRVVANDRRSDQRHRALHVRLADHGPHSSEDFAAGVAVRDEWARAVASLSADDQEVLALVFWDGLSTSDAATVLGCTSATFLTRLSRARRRLRGHLADPIPRAGTEDPSLVARNREETEPCHAPVEPI